MLTFRHLRILALTALASLLPGAVWSGEPSAAARADTQALPETITLTPATGESDRLRAGDRLRLQIVEDGSPAVEIQIGEDGRMDAPYLGFVEAAGLAVEELRLQLTAALEKDFYQKATVRLAVLQRAGKSVNMGRVYVAGEVRRIGQVEISKSDKALLSQVLLANGGFTDFADLRRVKIFRRNANGAVDTIIVNLRNIIELGKINEDVAVLDGDFILVGSKLVNW